MTGCFRLGVIACFALSGWGVLPPIALPVQAQVPEALICQPKRQWNLVFAAHARLGEEAFELEVATTPQQQAQGLMYRTQLGANQGMVFVFDPPQITGFWMWNTCIHLDIIFLSQGRVVEIAADVPPCRQQPCPVYGPENQRVDQVVEVRGGTAKRLGLAIGDPLLVTFDPS